MRRLCDITMAMASKPEMKRKHKIPSVRGRKQNMIHMDPRHPALGAYKINQAITVSLYSTQRFSLENNSFFFVLFFMLRGARSDRNGPFNVQTWSLRIVNELAASAHSGHIDGYPFLSICEDADVQHLFVVQVS